MGTEFQFGVMEGSGDGCWLHNIVNILNAVRYTLKKLIWSILRYIYFNSKKDDL